jgi:hypothetical protein
VPEDAARLEARAAEYVRLAAEADDPAVERDRLRQAAQARIQSGRMLDAIANGIEVQDGPPNWGVGVTFGAPRHSPAPVFSPGPR